MKSSHSTKMTCILSNCETTGQEKIWEIFLLFLCISFFIKSPFPKENLLNKFVPEYHGPFILESGIFFITLSYLVLPWNCSLNPAQFARL